ncbi:MAG: metallophosphoesterase, partial [Deltaproteobacteria bacterium]
MDENQRERIELHKTLQGSGERPGALRITRRIFLHKSLLTGAASVATYGWFPLIGTLDLTLAQAGGQATSFKFAWISDSHLLPKDVNTRFVDKAVRAMKEVQAMKPPADFLI